ncbi:hypothetical protein WJX81_000567 [Elliptochloris bilobata]|uniref:Uncharacterized protein n=1 Tax=Elliptochloris bilobata TaxID=381761 RepID=A0AAW1SI86_9CHLO
MGPCTEQKSLQRLANRPRAGSPGMDDKENVALGGWGSMEWHSASAEAWSRPEPPQGCSSPAVCHGTFRFRSTARRPLEPAPTNKQGTTGRAPLWQAVEGQDPFVVVSCPGIAGLRSEQQAAPTTPSKSAVLEEDGGASPIGNLPVFRPAPGNSPGCTPMPRSYGSILRDLPVAPKKFASVSPVVGVNAASLFNPANPCLQSCPARAQRRVDGTRSFVRVRVRRALNLQSGVRHSAPENPCAHSGEVPPRAPALLAARAGPSALLSRSADWQVGSNSGQTRKRPDTPGVGPARNTRARDTAWDAAAEGLARLSLGSAGGGGP